MNRGYVLLSTLMLASICLLLLISVHARLVKQWSQVNATEGQMHAMIAAQNGIELARSFLPSADPMSLLTGKDGVFEGSSMREWRNPVSFVEAMLFDPEGWIPAPDDGIPFTPEDESFRGRFHSSDGSFSLLRFSNNPEEPPDQDQDRVFIVRSMGVVPITTLSPHVPSVRNNVALIEARLRKEEAFLPLGAMTLVGDQGQFVWSSQLTVDGGTIPGITVVPVNSSHLLSTVIETLSDSGANGQIRGDGPSPSVSLFDAHNSDTQALHLLTPDFWIRFLSKLPEYAGVPESSAEEGPQLAYLSEGGDLDAPFQGLLVSQGDLSLDNGCVIEGLLVHVGGGTLTLQENALIRGGLWVCGMEAVNSELNTTAVRVEVNGAARIVLNMESVKRALGCLPATRLQWRILFPEMLP